MTVRGSTVSYDMAEREPRSTLERYAKMFRSDVTSGTDTVTKQVTLTITGANDAPVVTVVDPATDTEGDTGTAAPVSFDLFADLTTASDVDQTDTPAFGANVVVAAASGSDTPDTSLITVSGSTVSYVRAD